MKSGLSGALDGMFGHVVPAELEERLRAFYDGEVPNYVRAAIDTYVVFLVPACRDESTVDCKERRPLKITVKDVVEYWATDGKKFGAVQGATRLIAGYRGPWKLVAHLANEVSMWFRKVNPIEYGKQCRREGLDPFMCPLVERR